MADTVKWSNLTTAAPLCRHMLGEQIALEEQGSRAGFVEMYGLAQATGLINDNDTNGFGDFIRAAYAKLYEPYAMCSHKK